MSNQSQAIRAKQAANLLGIGLSTFWRWHKQRPNFPRGRKLSARVTVFDQDNLVAWRDAQASTPINVTQQQS